VALNSPLLLLPSFSRQSSAGTNVRDQPIFKHTPLVRCCYSLVVQRYRVLEIDTISITIIVIVSKFRYFSIIVASLLLAALYRLTEMVTSALSISLHLTSDHRICRTLIFLPQTTENLSKVYNGYRQTERFGSAVHTSARTYYAR
jgi:hypothetical protein